MADPAFPFGGADSVGGGGNNLPGGRFTVKMYAKMKEYRPYRKNSGANCQLASCKKLRIWSKKKKKTSYLTQDSV